MTKTQAKAGIRRILETIANLKDEVEDLKGEAEETSESIEPYDGKDDLTEAQYERQEWFEELTSTLEDLFDNLEASQEELEGKAE